MKLSRKMSFKDFLAQNNTERFKSILGVKGNCIKQNGDQLI